MIVKELGGVRLTPFCNISILWFIRETTHFSDKLKFVPTRFAFWIPRLLYSLF